MPLSNFGRVLFRAGDLQRADEHLLQSLTIHEKRNGGRSLDAVWAANDLADVRIAQARYPEAEALLVRAREVRESKLPAEHSLLATTFHSLGQLRERQGEVMEAETFYARALAIREKALPMDHPDRAKLLDDYARLLELRGQSAEAQQLRTAAETARAEHSSHEAEDARMV